MEIKFIKGDRVRFIGNVYSHGFQTEKLIEAKDRLVVDNIGKEGDITVIYHMGPAVWYRWVVKPEELELVYFTKRALREGDKITLRNRDQLILNSDGYFRDIEGDEDNGIATRGDLTDDLLCDGPHRDNDIIKVERPTYRTVFEREEETGPRKMTVAEISKELGYDVEIIKG